MDSAIKKDIWARFGTVSKLFLSPNSFFDFYSIVFFSYCILWRTRLISNFYWWLFLEKIMLFCILTSQYVEKSYFSSLIGLDDTFMVWNLNYNGSIPMSVSWLWWRTDYIRYFAFWRGHYAKNPCNDWQITVQLCFLLVCCLLTYFVSSVLTFRLPFFNNFLHLEFFHCESFFQVLVLIEWGRWRCTMHTHTHRQTRSYTLLGGE